MQQAIPEQYRRSISAIVAAAARLPKTMRGADPKRFLQTYYANVDAEDIAARDPARQYPRRPRWRSKSARSVLDPRPAWSSAVAPPPPQWPKCFCGTVQGSLVAWSNPNRYCGYSRSPMTAAKKRHASPPVMQR